MRAPALCRALRQRICLRRKTGSPRSQVSTTRPRSFAPRYGESLWRKCRSCWRHGPLAYPGRRPQGPHLHPASITPFCPARPASCAGCCSHPLADPLELHAALLHRSPHHRQSQPQARDSAPRLIPSAFLPAASSPAGKGSGRSSPCRSGHAPARSTILRDFAALRMGGAHLYSVAPSGISSAANQRYCAQVSTVIGTPRRRASTSDGKACALAR